MLILGVVLSATFLTACSSTPPLDKRNEQVAGYPVMSAMLTTDNTSTARKVLFIGNSIMYWHEVPKIFASLLKQIHPKSPTKIAYVVGNNYSLKDHWDAGRALEFINQKGPWDYVILQDSSGTEFYQTAGEARYIGAFIQAIRKTNAQPLLFQTYVDDASLALDSQDRFQKLADSHAVFLLPVGNWWNHARTCPGVELYDVPDTHHPSLLGSYLIALVTVLNIDKQVPANVVKGLTLTYSDKEGSKRLDTKLVNSVFARDLPNQ
jgi:hypothetical protein